MLELLATVDIDLDPDWQSLNKKVLMHADTLSACIVVLVDLDDHRRTLIRQWQATGMNLLVLLVTDENGEGKEWADLGVIAISRKNIESDLMTKLGSL